MKATSELPPHGEINYNAGNLVDRNLQTAWCAKSPRDANTELAIVIDAVTPIDGLGLINGYAKTTKAYTENDRVRRIRVHSVVAGAEPTEINDSVGPQWIVFSKTLQGEIKLAIADYYKGTKYDDVCVTEIILDRSTNDAVIFLFSLIKSSGTHARTAGAVKSMFQDFFSRYYQSGQKNRAFWDSLRLVVSGSDVESLRLILDLNFYAKNFRGVVDAELTEGLRDQIVLFIRRSPETVITVFSDKQQLMRERIVSAYVQFKDPYSEQNFAELLRRSPALKKLDKMVHEF